jgi:hypothetical protein
MDALAFEPQFLDHVAPVWRALGQPGQLRVDTSLVARADRLGLSASPVDAGALRRLSPPPSAQAGDGPIAFAVSIGDIKVGRRLGYRRFVFMEHGAGQAYVGDQHGRGHPSYAGGGDRQDVELFLVPNEYSAVLWREAYPDAAVAVVGCPKLDELPAREPGPETIAVSFHWPGFVAPEGDTALGTYAMSLKALARRFTVIGHAHPKGDWPERMERIYRRAGIEFVRDFDEVCRRADVYVCDNSSTIFEFAATGRPVVVLNAPHYRRNVHHGLRFWEAADVGVQVDRAEELEAAIVTALADPPERQAAREAALGIVYAHRHGGADRAARAIEEHLRCRPSGVHESSSTAEPLTV